MRPLVLLSVGLLLAVACSGPTAKTPPAWSSAPTFDAALTHATRPRPASACTPEPTKTSTASFDRRREKDPEYACTPLALDDTEDTILRPAGGVAAAPFVPWDGRSTPIALDRVGARLGLTLTERDLLRTQGFVVPARLSEPDYSLAYHEIYQSQLPIYVSIDSILHAIYAANDALLARIESTRLVPLLKKVLGAMYDALPDAAASYPPEVTADLDVYLGVARSLLEGAPVRSRFGNDAEIARLISRAEAAGAMDQIELFGRRRMVDWSQYKPRGHYARSAEASPTNVDLKPYFRAAMWLSRVEFNLVTRSCQSSSDSGDTAQTPREATSAVALADLATRASAMCEIERLDQAWSLLAGRREDVSIAELAALVPDRSKIAVAETSRALEAAIGGDFRRTARTQYTWEGCSELPVIATILGARIVPDASMARPLAHGETPGRQMIGAPDIAYALGHDRALSYLRSETAEYPSLLGNLGRARDIAKANLSGEDLYSAWFGAIREIATPPEGVLPSFMRTPAYADMRVTSTVAAFAQIRHNYVLMAAEPYGEAGCEIPDGYVEPAPKVYEALIAYARRGAEVMSTLDPTDESGSRAYFERLGRTLQVLQAIGKDELANRPLSTEEVRFLSMVVEITSGTHSTGGSPQFGGWYFDLFQDHEEAFGGAGFIADYFTSSETGRVAHVGVLGVRLGVFVVDSGGPPRVVVGPVTAAYGFTGGPGQRLTDVEATKLAPRERDERWMASYTASAAEEPPLALDVRTHASKAGKMPAVSIAARTSRTLGPVTIELYDHHRQVVRKVTQNVTPAGATFEFLPRSAKGDSSSYEGIHVAAGDYQAFRVGSADPVEGDLPFALGSGMKIRLGGMK
jgi:hypothetical protein